MALFGGSRSKHELALNRIAGLYKDIINSEHHVHHELRKAHHLEHREHELKKRLKGLENLEDAKHIGEHARKIIREEKDILRQMERYADRALKEIRQQRRRIRSIRRQL